MQVSGFRMPEVVAERRDPQADRERRDLVPIRATVRLNHQLSAQVLQAECLVYEMADLAQDDAVTIADRQPGLAIHQDLLTGRTADVQIGTGRAIPDAVGVDADYYRLPVSHDHFRGECLDPARLGVNLCQGRPGKSSSGDKDQAVGGQVAVTPKRCREPTIVGCASPAWVPRNSGGISGWRRASLRSRFVS